MPNLNARGILLDIEGTTSSIHFVHEVMFPFVRENLNWFLSANWETESLQACLPLLASDLGHLNVEKWPGESSKTEQQSIVAEAVIQLMDGDVKATGLKQLQGLIWESGFHSGQLVAHLYPEVAPVIRAWVAAGIDVRVYSSGSVVAQKLFFGHTVEGNLLDCFSGHYDTKTGAKQEPASYQKIASEFACSPDEIVFISDVPAELTAAALAGMQTVLSLRPGNQPVTDDHGFIAISGFDELAVSLP